MSLVDFSKLSAKELYSEEVICQIMDEPDPLIREQLGFDLVDCAEVFGDTVKKRVEKMLKLAEKDMKSKEKERQKKTNSFDRYTDFGGRYPEMKCGNWIANMNGIYNPDAMPENRLACSHPILPIEIIANVEDGTQKIKIAFCKNNFWREQIIPKVIIANRSKIPELAGIGVSVTSETAKSLVKYLAEVEQLNLSEIPEIKATAKMGWCEDGFMPYMSGLSFDKDGRFDVLFDTLATCGNRQKWLDFVLEIRATKRIEPRLAMAASLASVLIKPCGLLPFWVDIWGRSGGGKTICEMFAASVWADPELGKYISKFDDTINAFEAKAGFLNHLPFIIDDTAELRRKIKDDFSQLIYQLSSGEGRGRSNTKLGLAYKNTWKNIIICSGESPIITDQLQGGAINRVLEYEADEGDMFPDGQTAATLLRNNYGFIGKEFVEIVNKLGLDKISQLQRDCFDLIKNDNYESKQLLSLSILLVADRIATEYIFKDNISLTFEEVEKALTDKNTLSENERCYSYIISECDINNNKFGTNYYGDYQGEMWGAYREEGTEHIPCIAIVPNIFKRICASGGFSARAFLSWATKKGLIFPGAEGKTAKVVKIQGKPIRCYVLRLPEEEIENENDD